MEKTARILNDFKIPFEMNALSAHRTPEEVEKFAKGAAERGIKVIIAAAGMAAHLPGVIAAMTPLPVIGVPIKASLDGLDSVFSILQMPPGIPVATVGIDAAQNAGILAAQIIGTGDEEVMKEVVTYKESLKKKIVDANKELKEVKFPFKTN
jgi:5-(carboxyamino)imidazole ribonucleotide mutase